MALLARAYARSFELARLHGAHTIAFPAIATGQYGFPKPTAAAVALTVAVQVLELEPQFESVTFCTYDDDTRQIYEALIEEGTRTTFIRANKDRPLNKQSQKRLPLHKKSAAFFTLYTL